MNTNLSPAAYWEQRARQYATVDRGLPAVCSYGMPGFYNRYIEATQRRALLPWFERVAPGTRTALDMGCGVGRWSLELAARGYTVSGVDLSPSMLEQANATARARGLRCEFAVGDITTLALDRQFDLITCVTVVQHVTEPVQAAHALRRLAAHLAPGGRLLLLEAAPGGATSRCDTAIFKARTYSWYLQALQGAGLQLEAQCGVDPLPLKSWLLPAYRRMPRALAQLALGAVTAASWPLDLILAPHLPAASWHKLMVCSSAAGHGIVRGTPGPGA